MSRTSGHQGTRVIDIIIDIRDPIVASKIRYRRISFYLYLSLSIVLSRSRVGGGRCAKANDVRTMYYGKHYSRSLSTYLLAHHHRANETPQRWCWVAIGSSGGSTIP